MLWDFVSFVYGTFDYYSTHGATDDIYHIQLNGYKLILEQVCAVSDAVSTPIARPSMALDGLLPPSHTSCSTTTT